MSKPIGDRFGNPNQCAECGWSNSHHKPGCVSGSVEAICNCGHFASDHGDISPEDLALGGPTACRHTTCKCVEFSAHSQTGEPA